MTIARPTDLLSIRHVIALLEVVQSDAYIAELTAEPEESIPPALTFASTSRLLSEIRSRNDVSDAETAGQILDEATSLLELHPVRNTLAGPSLLVLQRVALVVLHNTSSKRSDDQSPF